MNLSVREAAATLALAGSLVLPSAASADVPVVLVANSKDGTVQIVDAETFGIRRTIDVVPGGAPSTGNPSLDRDPTQTANTIFVNELAGDNFAQDLDLSPDGETLYVSRGHMADVAAFDLTVNPAELLWTARVDGFRADHMTISADGETLYISDLTEYQVIALDAATGDRRGSFPTGQYAHGVTVVVTEDAVAEDGLGNTLSPENEVTPDANCAFLPEAEGPDRCVYSFSIGDITLFPRELRDNQPDEANLVLSEPYQLTIADAETLEIVRTIEFPSGIRPEALSLEGEERILYYQESFHHGVVEYDLVEGREIRRVQLPIDEGVTEDDYSFESPHHGLAISPDGTLLCAAGRASDYAALVSTETLLPVAVLDAGDAPGWAITGPLGLNCWVANTGSEATDEQPPADTLTVVSYGTNQVIATIGTGGGPKHLLAARVPLEVLDPQDGTNAP